LRKELDVFGINPESVVPDLEGLANYVNWVTESNRRDKYEHVAEGLLSKLDKSDA